MILTLPNTPSSDTVPDHENDLMATYHDVISSIASVELYPSDKCNAFLLKSLDAMCSGEQKGAGKEMTVSGPDMD